VRFLPTLSAIVLALQAASAADPLQQVWELRLAEKIIEPAGWKAVQSHPIVDLVFSPDGRKLAVTMDDHYENRVHRTHLLIVGVENPQGDLRQIDLETCGKFLAWAPDGGAILVCGRVVRLSTGSSCDLLRADQQSGRFLRISSYWLTADRVILDDRTMVDLACQPIEKWAVEDEGTWFVAGTVPAKAWVLLRQTTRKINGRMVPFNDYAIADLNSHRVTSDSLWHGLLQDTGLIVAEGADAVCSELLAAGEYKSENRCWNLPSGEVLSRPPAFAKYRMTGGSLLSSRVVAERWGYHRLDFFGEVPDMLSLMVLDIRSGRRIASLKPRRQRGGSSTSFRDSYFHCALSPNGELLAEGGDGVVTLEQLP
jgi:dipeptidyl aminopeptidase/acylaminoacyl peptidase